jgi:hypothetical protein
MKEKKLFGFFYKDLWLQFHYVMLTAGLFFAYFLGDKFIDLTNLSPIKMFIFWLISIALIDQFIHFVIGRD